MAESGWNGLTIAEVCRRAGVSAPSIYARVDGKAGLFLAVHERLLAEMRTTEDQLIHEHVADHRSAEDAAAAAARVIAGVFDIHGRALRSLIDRSAHDPQMLARGGAASRQLLARLAQGIPLEERSSWTVLRAVYAECVMRLMYGPSLLKSSGDIVDAGDGDLVMLARALARGLSAEGG